MIGGKAIILVIKAEKIRIAFEALHIRGPVHSTHCASSWSWHRPIRQPTAANHDTAPRLTNNNSQCDCAEVT